MIVDPVIGITAAAGVGAVLFFASGYFARMLGRSSRMEALEIPLGPDLMEPELADQNTALRTERDLLLRRMKKVAREVEVAREEQAEFSRARDQLGAMGVRLEQANADLEASRRQTQQVSGRARALEQEAERARAQAKELEGQLERLRSEASTIAQLRNETEAMQKTAVPPQAPPPVAPSTLVRPRLRGLSLEQQLAALVAEDGCKAAVVADREGLVVASAGCPEQTRKMAASAAVFSRLEERARGHLPLPSARSLHVHGDADGDLHCQLFERHDRTLVLATLGEDTTGASQDLVTQLPESFTQSPRSS